MNRKAVVILSGGQDSMTCLFWALKQYDKVEAISFHYGQSHSVELEQARKIGRRVGIPHYFIDLSFMDTINESALINGGDVNAKNAKGLPASFVPNRNAMFIVLAHTLAQKLGAEALVTGVCQTDYSGYPDCRRDFIDKIELALNMGSDSRIHIDTPLMYINKAQTFAMAADLGRLQDVVEMSHTCYKGDRSKLHAWGFGCGKCPACVLRKNGYNEYLDSIK